ncbi:ABC transporter permease [Paenibacillus crassostreae]|uniref:Protein lplB n=1 Tax=Paenibacillus crassostreae TaxID=1763538 RepID=A0A167FD39_9BACL|nr:ABC transporter permease subunit [Paenibacillus crassostreae]AOZ90806.1 protein lplB [Paenibacillus crassostreae]OAB76428.1 protein lplB [Paenibacillus crassostreae]
MLNKIWRQREFHFMLIPGVVLVFIFSYLPFYGLIISFQDYNPGLGFNSPWVGMENFEHVFHQPNFLRTIWNTLYMSVFKIIGGVIVPVIFALLLNEVARTFIKRTFQTLVYLPNFLSWVIMAGIMIDILGSGGIVNSFLGLFGVAPISFLGDPSIFPWSMIITDVWKGFGFGTVVYLAALASIDPGLYEAAVIDGAKRWKQTLYITLPLLTPTIVLMSVLSLSNVLNAGFDQIFNLYSPSVYESGDIIDTYVYRLGIQQAQYSVGTAIGLFKSVVSCIMVTLSYFLAHRVAGYRIF